MLVARSAYLKEAACVFRERVHVPLCVAFTAVHAEGPITGLTEVMIALFSLFNDVITLGANLIVQGRVQRH